MAKKICCIMGTRPEVIKMAPVVVALQQESWAHVRILNTAQHRELSDPLYTFFNIKPDIDLNIMKPGQTLTELTANLMLGINKNLLSTKPDIVIGQGDTSTVLAASLVSFHNQIPFAHVEAGLRTHQLYNPFPEEANRRLISSVASLHFAPTAKSKEHLLKENISEARIYVTGNTAVDAALFLSKNKSCSPFVLKPGNRLILVTVHRRENLDQPLQNICKALLRIVNQNPDVDIIFPLHANPHVQKTVKAYLGHHSQILICQPLAYDEFIATLKLSYLILTDSGGIQEEASIFGKPILILREATERWEIVTAGLGRLVGTQTNMIVSMTQELLDDFTAYQQMSQSSSCLYGDGNAAKKIVKIIKKFLTED